MTRGIREAATAALIVLLLAGCGGDEPPPIETATVTRATVSEVVEAPAQVAAKASATVTAPSSGTVERLQVEDGERVKAGQVLLRIESPQAEAQLEQAQRASREASSAGSARVQRVDLSGQQGQLDKAAGKAFDAAREAAEQVEDPEARSRHLAAVAAAEAQYRSASRQSQAAVESFNAGLGSLADALSSLSRAQRVQADAALALAERTVESLTVRAPISGVVSLGSGTGGGGPDLAGALSQLPESVQGQAGDLLGAAGGGGGGGSSSGAQGMLAVGSPVSTGAALLSVTDTSTLALTAEVDETDVLLVEPGVHADVELDAVPGATYAAEVTSVDVASTSSGRGGVSYVVRLALGGGTTETGDPAPRPRPGMSAVADLRVREAKDAVSVPASAVFRDERRDAVWVVTDGVPRKRQVRLGAQGEDAVEVVEGVQPGESVVVRGADRVVEGQPLP